MKITKEVLKQIIAEEIQNTLQESKALDAAISVHKIMEEGEIAQLMKKLGFKPDGNTRDRASFFFTKTFDDGSRGTMIVEYKIR